MIHNGHITVSIISFKLLLEQLNDYLCQYEELNLGTYAGTKYENFLLFKHPMKSEAKD